VNCMHLAAKWLQGPHTLQQLGFAFVTLSLVAARSWSCRGSRRAGEHFVFTDHSKV
jgi:hypothetical protein